VQVGRRINEPAQKIIAAVLATKRRLRHRQAFQDVHAIFFRNDRLLRIGCSTRLVAVKVIGNCGRA
jgi:hypothetical protein